MEVKTPIQTLPRIITRNGFTYTQVRVKGRYYVYEQTSRDKSVTHEVFKAVILPEKDLFGTHYPRRHKFPSNNEFGVNAWSYWKLETAIKKFVEISQTKKG